MIELNNLSEIRVCNGLANLRDLVCMHIHCIVFLRDEEKCELDTTIKYKRFYCGKKK